MPRKKKFKHTQLFQTKDDLRRERDQARRDHAVAIYSRNDAENRATRLAAENQKLTNKLVSDSFLIQELKQQIAQQHIQLVNAQFPARVPNREKNAKYEELIRASYDADVDRKDIEVTLREANDPRPIREVFGDIADGRD